jgi:hypothetical protein
MLKPPTSTSSRDKTVDILSSLVSLNEEIRLLRRDITLLMATRTPVPIEKKRKKKKRLKEKNTSVCTRVTYGLALLFFSFVIFVLGNIFGAKILGDVF